MCRGVTSPQPKILGSDVNWGDNGRGGGKVSCCSDISQGSVHAGQSANRVVLNSFLRQVLVFDRGHPVPVMVFLVNSNTLVVFFFFFFSPFFSHCGVSRCGGFGGLGGGEGSGRVGVGGGLKGGIQY